MKTGLEGTVYRKKVIVDELHKAHNVKGTHAIEVFTHYASHKNSNNDEFAIVGMDSYLPFHVINQGLEENDEVGGERVTINQKMSFNIIFNARGYNISTTLDVTVKIPTTRSESIKVQDGIFQPVRIPGIVRDSDDMFVKRRVEEMMADNKHMIMKHLPESIEIRPLTERGEYISVLKNKGIAV